ncbi:MBOAT family O-acyltransferase [Ulvibacter litoralis]|uniref:D-alanyl-lipoteichoic acid acyltransferase DltB, MBOAT superfamily n=1 Tax=Ulvibacter litoralis TaxID=227084 RepID=A0A1G7GZN7_9FLAO|nr:MBOAT family O-acyltransferase [Ulvibacter litoralis]GHC59499.1 O-acyltransferase [Ulvibacter litoralis]SDE93575.1 D-alanyl-lipoteichoic acid acyltransferase DltB, MBOAT superfamily [Ulvibacter litoralis]
MLFNSIDFALFLPIVFLLYWFVTNKSLKLQNLLLVAASYLFYGWWDWRFLFLILFSTLVDYTVGIALSKEKEKNKRLVLIWISILVNLGLLGFFKYYNFFLDNFTTAFSFFGRDINSSSLNIILPVGISFYTFQTLSYTIDVYKGKLTPTKDFVAFSAFVSFFPQLVAGPIERATNLLPQITSKRVFNPSEAKDGLYLILWGLFKKIVIADSCAVYVNEIFSNYEQMNSLTLLLGAVYFAFQIYGDFSGYSDIAIGTSKLFGVHLMRNFNFPYFSRDIAEFWRKWHISLSTWFRDYLYIPLGGSKVSKLINLRNIFIIFLVSGFWHGANWTFIVWGGLHALYFIPLSLTNRNRKNLNIVSQGKMIPSFRELYSMLLTFFLVLIGWIFFRADSVAIAFDYIQKLFAFNFKSGFQYLSTERYAPELMILIIGFIIVEWSAREKEHPFFGKWIHLKIIATLVSIILLGVYSNVTDFIYFQF